MAAELTDVAPAADATTNANDAMVDLLYERAIDLLRLEVGTRDKVVVLLDALEKEIVAAVAAIDPTGPARAKYQRDRLIKLQVEVEASIRATYRLSNTLLGQEIREVVDTEATWTASAINSSIQATFADVGLTRTLLDTLVSDVLIQGAPTKEWWSRQAGGLADAFQDQMRRGVAIGEPLNKLIDRVRGTATQRGIMDIARSSAERLVRSSVQTAANSARTSVYEQNADLIKSLQWHATLDTRTSIFCLVRDGHQYSVADKKALDDGPPWDMGPGASHWNCLPGSTLVTTRHAIRGASKRWYDGQLVIVRTASGKELASTPNHPILTDAGWVASGLLNVGDNVVCNGDSEWQMPSLNMDHENVPTAIQEIAEATLRSVKMIAGPMPTSAEDFHGDGIDGNIAIVATDRFLQNRLTPALQKQTSEKSLIPGYASLSYFAGYSDFDTVRLALSRTASCILRGFSELLSLGWRRACHASGLLLRSVARLNTMLSQNAVYYGGGYIVAFTNGNRPDTRSMLGNDQRDRQACMHNTVFHFDTALSENTKNCFVGHAKLTGNRSDRQSGVIKGFGFSERNDNLVPAQLDAGTSENSADVGCGHSKKCGHFGDRFVLSVTPDNLGSNTGADQSHLFKPITDFNTSVDQYASDGAVRDAQLASDILRGSTGCVFLDDVVSVERCDFAGHVFNLETEKGFYTANGIITHNCRSTSIPILKSWRDIGIDADEVPETTRASMDGQVAAETTFEGWLKKQSAARQDTVLGAGKAGLWRSGKITFRDLLDQNGRPLTTEQLRAKYAAAS